MAIQLVRRPGVDIDPADAGAARAWIREQVRQQVVTKGEPHPKIWLLGKDFVETLDLDAMGRKEPGAHLGLTFQLVRRRRRVERCFLVIRLTARDGEGHEHSLALVFEERDVPGGRRWWMSMLAYRTDPQTGLGHPQGDWQPEDAETGDPAELPPFLAEIASPPPGSRPADVRDASDTWIPDLRFAFGELPAHVEPPTDAKRMVEIAGGLAVDELLTGKIQGAVVVRIVGRSWEQWVLTGDLPASIDEMIRWVANDRLPAAEGVALVQIAVRQGDDPPVPGAQVIAELGGFVVETWAPIRFLDGPGGRKEIPEIRWWPARPVDPARRWLGVASSVTLEPPVAVDELAPAREAPRPPAPVRPIRRPLDGVSPWDVEAVRTWAIQRANDEVLRHARVTPRLLLVCQDHVEDVDLEEAEGDPVETFFALAGRSDVEHRILSASVDEGDEHVAWVFGAANDDEKSFWMATRAFTRLPGGLGSGGTTWQLSWGVALAGPLPPMNALGRDGGPFELLPAQPPPLPKVFARTDDAPPQAVVPTDPVAATNVISELGHEAQLFHEPSEGVTVFVFRGRTLETWKVVGEIPVGLDDLVRAACAKGETPAAVVVLRLDLFEYEGRYHRAVKMTSEAGGERWERILAMLFSEGDTDRPSNAQYFGSEPKPVGDDGWIGVAPVTELELFTVGIEA